MRRPPLQIRRITDADDVDALTALLHRAYAPLAAQGLRYVATWQGPDITRKRIRGSERMNRRMSAEEIEGIVDNYRQRLIRCETLPDDETYAARFHRAYMKKDS